MRRSKLRLPDVTLVAVDTVAHELTRMAVQQCLEHVDFGEVLIFSDKPIKVAGARRQRCEATNKEALLQFRWTEAPQFIRTSHYLIIEWDSWIIDPGMWRPEFLDCDYIGAPWGWYDDGMNVGNGGFSLRSARLAQFVARRPDQFPYLSVEDCALCRTYRPALERQGFRWADAATASDFAVEHTVVAGHDRHFGFHGVFNWPFVLSDSQIRERMRRFNPYVIQHPHLHGLFSSLARQSAGDVSPPWKITHL
jgi:Protein of unknown function (DUF5672)